MSDAGEQLGGGCACGAVRYTCGPPLLSYKCHCLDCQRASGSDFAPLFWSAADRFVLVAGEPRDHTTVLPSGRTATRGFCPDCGSPLLGKLSVIVDIVGILAPSLDDPSHFVPEYETWTSRARPWTVLDPALPHFPENFSREVVARHLAARSPGPPGTS